MAALPTGTPHHPSAPSDARRYGDAFDAGTDPARLCPPRSCFCGVPRAHFLAETFYLLPTCAWERGVGVLLALPGRGMGHQE